MNSKNEFEIGINADQQMVTIYDFHHKGEYYPWWNVSFGEFHNTFGIKLQNTFDFHLLSGFGKDGIKFSIKQSDLKLSPLSIHTEELLKGKK